MQFPCHASEEGMNADEPTRAGVIAELSIILVATIAFLVVFQTRPRYLDAVLGLAAVALIALASRRSRKLWMREQKVQSDPRLRAARATRLAAAFTLPVTVLFLLVGLRLGYSAEGWGGALERVGNWHLLPALLLYLAWGLLQQFVFQFYLLGRLLYILPAAAAIALTGIAFSMVHFPRVPVMAVTLIAGIVWALIYRRYRSLLPLAVSHALLGATLHYWVFGRDLLELWLLAR